jgi:SAM-dependent methyltransferase
MTYSKEYFTARESWRDWRMEANQLINLARVSKGTRVLEIGCGGGGLLRLLSARGASVVGVDTLDVALNLARERFLLKEDKGKKRPGDSDPIAQSPILPPSYSLIQIGENVTHPFADNSFDAILGQHVVEHVPNIDAALHEWKRLLKPGGRIALATPNVLYPHPAHFADDDHAHVCSPNELRGTLIHAGLTVESCYTLFPYLSRVRILRAFGVVTSSLFRYLPYFAEHGRTIMIVARKS